MDPGFVEKASAHSTRLKKDSSTHQVARHPAHKNGKWRAARFWTQGGRYDEPPKWPFTATVWRVFHTKLSSSHCSRQIDGSLLRTITNMFDMKMEILTVRESLPPWNSHIQLSRLGPSWVTSNCSKPGLPMFPAVRWSQSGCFETCAWFRHKSFGRYKINWWISTTS